MQSSSTLPDQRSYTFKLVEVTSVADCGSLLRSLTKEVDTALYFTCKCTKLYNHLRVTTDLL